jgi:hypothetical protein
VERSVSCLVDDADGWRSEWSVPMFWVYWDTAWSIILSGIMVATILAHPDAEFVEVAQQRAGDPWRRREM